MDAKGMEMRDMCCMKVSENLLREMNEMRAGEDHGMCFLLGLMKV